MTNGTFLGVYAIRNKAISTHSKTSNLSKHHWFVWKNSNGYTVQLLNNAFQPVAEPRLLSSEIFQKNFENQPHILAVPITTLEPNPLKNTKKNIAQYENQNTQQLLDKDVSPTQFSIVHHEISHTELEKAQYLDNQIRSEFSSALSLWHAGDKILPLQTFKQLSTIQEGIIPIHKHMFTDFGVDLRKNNLPKLAILHFKRAVELSPGDSNAHFNIARVYYELGDLEQAEQHLKLALAITPNFNVALKLLELIHDQKNYS